MGLLGYFDEHKLQDFGVRLVANPVHSEGAAVLFGVGFHRLIVREDPSTRTKSTASNAVKSPCEAPKSSPKTVQLCPIGDLPRGVWSLKSVLHRPRLTHQNRTTKSLGPTWPRPNRVSKGPSNRLVEGCPAKASEVGSVCKFLAGWSFQTCLGQRVKVIGPKGLGRVQKSVQPCRRSAKGVHPTLADVSNPSSETHQNASEKVSRRPPRWVIVWILAGWSVQICLRWTLRVVAPDTQSSHRKRIKTCR